MLHLSLFYILALAVWLLFTIRVVFAILSFFIPCDIAQLRIYVVTSNMSLLLKKDNYQIDLKYEEDHIGEVIHVGGF